MLGSACRSRRWTSHASARGLLALPALPALLAAGACALPTPEAGAPPRRVLVADSLARHAIANEQAMRAAAMPARTVGVAPLAVDAADSLLAPLGYGLADLLLTDLSRSRQLRVVDRVRTDALIRELRLSSSEAADSTAAPRLGRLLQARRLVIGAIAGAADAQGARSAGDRKLVIEARVADAADGTITHALSGAASLDDILAAEKQLAFRLFDLLGVTLTPAERAAVEQRPTRDLGALLAYSRGVRSEAQRDFQAAASEYSAALRLDPGFVAARASLTSVQQRPAESGQVRRASANVTAAVNNVGISVGSSAADPAFQAVQRPVTIALEVRIP